MPTSPGSPGSHSRRSNLFVVRIWREDTGGTTSSTEGEDGEEGENNGSRWQWEGRIQRAVSGEEHHFQGWPAFIGLLEEMLSDAQQVSGRGRTAMKSDAKPGAEDSAGSKSE